MSRRRTHVIRNAARTVRYVRCWSRTLRSEEAIQGGAGAHNSEALRAGGEGLHFFLARRLISPPGKKINTRRLCLSEKANNGATG